MANIPNPREYSSAPASDWAALNPKLGAGEMAVESDTGKFKVGNGTTNYNDLSLSGLPHVFLTQAAYDALGTPNANTLYVIIEE